jgi:ankyrin repeat protein
MIAAQKGFAEIAKLLLAHGANPTLTTPVRADRLAILIALLNFVFLCFYGGQ